MDPSVAAYIDAIPPEHRSLFDRLHGIIVAACPEASVTMSYKMPTYRIGKRRLHLAAWKHGISIYGWKASGDAGFTARHPELRTSTGTIQLTPVDAAKIEDRELEELARQALLD